MKYIFDFDDVLFNTRNFKKNRVSVFAKAGIPEDLVEKYLKDNKVKHFSLKKLMVHFSIENFYEEIMSKNKDFINTDLVEIVKKLGKENCFIVTFGDDEFQMEKIKSIGIEPLFSKIVVVQDEKKEEIEKICEKYKDEKVIFIDDRPNHFENLDFKKYPNLKTILYTGQKLNFA